MNTLCRECGKPAAPEYADEHDGLCMSCVHRNPTVFGPFTVEGSPLTVEMKALGITGIHGLADIDHDIVQPQPSDPIRDAIDQACVDLFDRKT